MNRTFIVLGGAGVIGRVVVRDLFESHRANRITVADFNAAKAAEYARSFRSQRVRAEFADATQPLKLAGVLRGHTVVVNCTQHDFNLRVMEAARRARTHYVDLGGLFTWTRKQLKLDARFKRTGLVAVLGMGCAPGITNVLARAGVDQLGREPARSVKIRVGTSAPEPSGFVFPYSARTIVEEFTLEPYVFRAGRFRKTKPRTGWERVTFPQPVGTVWTLLTRHSEVATLPVTLGLRYCDFKVGFDRAFVNEVMKRIRQGWTPGDFARLPGPSGFSDDREVARVIVDDRLVLDCLARANKRWRASAGDVDTGCPPSIVAQMIVDGRIAAPGVHAPESVVPVPVFFEELTKRAMKITVAQVAGPRRGRIGK
jgi:saccharopine dehydrogenase-like NADP-dependent oxidoreductase